MKIYAYFLFFLTFVTKVIWCDTEAKMKILGSLTATDMDVIKEKLDKIQNLVSNITLCRCNPHGGGEWTVIQKRYDGSVEFHRNWKEYENGFGDKHGEFWLGNKNIAQLTSVGNHELRIDVEDWDGNKRYAVYNSFSIGDASTKYRLSISNYSGNAGDGMSYFNGMKFTTSDQDNDKHGHINCANYSYFNGGWWYNNCWTGNEAILNGHYTQRNNPYQGIIYKSFKKTSLKKSTMKIRKV